MRIEDLHDDPTYELILELEHERMMPFLQQELGRRNQVVRSFSAFNWFCTLGMLLFGGWQLYHGILGPGQMVLYFFVGVALSMSVLILVHEGIHALAYLLVGARNIHFGGSFRKLYFYAVADRCVLSRRRFHFVALTPFWVIFFAGIIILPLVQPEIQWIIFGLVLIHNWNCAGDFALLSYYYEHSESELWTYDDVRAGKSYFFKQIFPSST